MDGLTVKLFFAALLIIILGTFYTYSILLIIYQSGGFDKLSIFLNNIRQKYYKWRKGCL